MAIHSSVLAWRIPGTGEPGGLPSMGSHRVGHDWSDLAAVAAAAGWWIDPWVGKIPWRRKWKPTSVFLPGKSHGQRSLVGYSPWGHKELDTTEWLHFQSHFLSGWWMLTKLIVIISNILIYIVEWLFCIPEINVIWATSLSLFTFMHRRRKWQPTPVFLPGESQGQGSLVGCVCGVTQSRTQLKWLSSSSSSSIYQLYFNKKLRGKYRDFTHAQYFPSSTSLTRIGHSLQSTNLHW